MAFADFKRARRLAPHDEAVTAGALTGMARCRRREGQFAAASVHLVEALRTTESQPGRMIPIAVRLARPQIESDRLREAENLIGQVRLALSVHDLLVRLLSRAAEPEQVARTVDPDSSGRRPPGLAVEPPVAPGAALLEATGPRKSFDGVTAVRDVSFTVNAGETVGLTGPNGAGKTTTFELLSGFTRPDAGKVTFAGTRRDPDRSRREGARHGLIRSFQDAALFPTMTVQECVLVALEPVCLLLDEPSSASPSARRRPSAGLWWNSSNNSA